MLAQQGHKPTGLPLFLLQFLSICLLLLPSSTFLSLPLCFRVLKANNLFALYYGEQNIM